MNDHPIQNQDVIQLLGDLKDKGAEYPADLLENRRAAFEKSIGAFGISIIAWRLFGFQGSFKITAATDFLIRWVLISFASGIMATNAYIYRDVIRDFLIPPPPTVESSGPVLQPYLTAYKTPAPDVSQTPTSTLTPTATSTALWNVQLITPTFDSESVIEKGVELTATATKPGNRFGQTPTPPGQRDDD